MSCVRLSGSFAKIIQQWANSKFNGHSISSAIHSVVECWNGNLKNQLKRLLILCFLLFLVHILSKAVWSLMWLFQEGFIILGHFWLMIRATGIEIIRPFFGNLGLYPGYSWVCYGFLFPTANPGQLCGYPSKWEPGHKRSWT